MPTINNLKVRALTLAIAMGCAGVAFADTVPTVLFSNTGTQTLKPGQTYTQNAGTTQLRTPDGSTISIVGPAQYTIRPDGSFELLSGAITVIGGGSSRIYLPNGAQLVLSAGRSAGTVTVAGRQISGSVFAGSMNLNFRNGNQIARPGESWRTNAAGYVQKTLGNAPVAVTSADIYAKWLAMMLANVQSRSLTQSMDAAAVKKLIELQTYLQNGGKPTGFKGGDISAILAAYQTWAQRTGALGVPSSFQSFITQLIAYVAGGGKMDSYPQLPLYLGYQASLDAYRAFLLGGGLPSEYNTLSAAQIQAILTALQQAGTFSAYLGANNAFWADYLSWIKAGNNPDYYAGLPNSLPSLLARYTDALNLMYAYLGQGGMPSQYSALTAAQMKDYLAKLQQNGKLQTMSGDQGEFWRAYYAYLLANVTAGIDTYPQLRVYVNYQAALDAYRAYLMGGGVPSAYTALTAEQIRNILALLDVQGSFAAYLNANNNFWADYLSWIKAGNNPDYYAALPNSLPNLLASYTDALNLMYAYLGQGGLPSQYNALTAAQMKDYLAKLQQNGKLQTMSGDQGEFWRAYYAYLLANATAGIDTYPQLRVYVNYQAALDAYRAYLMGGGVPSAYTALTAEQIRNILALLDAQGSFAAYLNANNNFWAQYLSWVTAGKNPDQYTALPSANTVVTFDAFVVSAANMPGTFQTKLGQTEQSVTLTRDKTSNVLTGSLPNGSDKIGIPSGALANDNETNFGSGMARLSSGSGGGKFTIDSKDYAYTQRQGLHYAWVPALTSWPSALILKYTQNGATKPTTNSGSGLPGTLTSEIAINFKSSLFRIAAAGTIIMPGDTTYSFSTPGGLAGIETTAPTVSSSGAGSGTGSFTANMTGTGVSCPAGQSCFLDFKYQLGGSTANLLGAAYASRSSGQSDNLVGAVQYIQNGIYTPPAISTPLPLAGNTIQDMLGMRFRKDVQSWATDLNTQGYTVNFDAQTNIREIRDNVVSGSYNVDEYTAGNNGHNGDAAAWSTWREGRVGPPLLHQWVFLRSIQPDLAPATGTTVNYNLISGAGLAPTLSGSSNVSGTVTGTAAVRFNTAFSALFGMNLNAVMNGTTYAFATTGGSAAPSVQVSKLYVGSNNGYSATYSMRTADTMGGLCSGTTGCLATGTVLIGGPSANQIAASYTAFNHVDTSKNFGGLAVFSSDPPPSPTTPPVAMVTPLAGNTIGNLIGVQLEKGGTVFTSKADAKGYRASFDANTKITDITPITSDMTERPTGWTVSNTGHNWDTSAWSTWGNVANGMANFKTWAVMRPIGAADFPVVDTFISFVLREGAGLAPTRSQTVGNDGRFVTGTQTGNASVWFKDATTAKVGIELTAAINDKTYAFKTSGGVVSPGISLTKAAFGDGFGFTGNFTMATQDEMGGTCTGAACRASGNIAVGGKAGSQVLVSYATTNHADASKNFGGIAVFDKTHATTPGASALTPSPASTDWGRWVGPAVNVPAPTPVNLPAPVIVGEPVARTADVPASERIEERVRATTGLNIRFER